MYHQYVATVYGWMRREKLFRFSGATQKAVLTANLTCIYVTGLENPIVLRLTTLQLCLEVRKYGHWDHKGTPSRAKTMQ
jgi:hypothetical protein